MNEFLNTLNSKWTLWANWLLSWWLCLFPWKGPLTDCLYVWKREKQHRKGEEKKRQGQGQDTSCPGSNLQSPGSLISDKNSVNQEAKETPAWALCLYKTDRAFTSVSHFVGIYSSWGKFYLSDDNGKTKLEPRLRFLCGGFAAAHIQESSWELYYLFSPVIIQGRLTERVHVYAPSICYSSAASCLAAATDTVVAHDPGAAHYNLMAALSSTG